MRPIEFRAWDRTSNKDGVMVQWGELQKFEVGIVFMKLSEVIMMQYTGLKDNNGAKIFEGDILDQTKFPDDDPCPYSVVFEDGSFRKKYPGWDETLQKPIIDDLNLELDFCVIGNIHENPELLIEDPI